MSKPQPSSEGETSATRTSVPDPKKNPSYPAREHLHEKPHWQAILTKADSQIAPFAQRLGDIEKIGHGIKLVASHFVGGMDEEIFHIWSVWPSVSPPASR